MKLFKTAVAFAFVTLSPVCAQEKDAMKDLQLGMQGLQEAAKNPALLAQLMQDLQDPAMMAEAKKMMDNPEFQKEMKKMSKSKEFQDGVQKSVDMMKDPNAAAQMEAKMEHMMKVGKDELKKGAGAAMEDAMAAMANPEVMAEMTKMMKDPQFQAQIAAMAKDPSFKNYVSAMEEMMQDPAKKKKIEKASAEFRAQL